MLAAELTHIRHRICLPATSDSRSYITGIPHVGNSISSRNVSPWIIGTTSTQSTWTQVEYPSSNNKFPKPSSDWLDGTNAWSPLDQLVHSLRAAGTLCWISAVPLATWFHHLLECRLWWADHFTLSDRYSIWVHQAIRNSLTYNETTS